ncbi:MAG TPA: DUF4055 domain-containing protein, partial [Prosthecobacter sp.]|nr:DUF4055 domain-containing protein [Prosthecobacter sp.]
PVDSTHAQYDAALPKWQRARDVLAGEDALKAAAEKYVPRLDSQTDAEFAAYINRACFYNAVARTLEGYGGLVFRRDPVMHLPEGPMWKDFENDVDLIGTSLYLYCKQIFAEVIGLGRCGTLIDWENDEARPFFSLYKAEQILNWRMARVDGKNRLVLVVLAEDGPPVIDEDHDEFQAEVVPQIRVMRLIPRGETGSCAVEIFQQQKKEGKKEKEWVSVGSLTPLRRGLPLPGIPFVFHGPKHGSPDVAKPPLEDVITVNLDHYRLDADFKHGLHFTAMPTAWVSGFPADSQLRVGATTAWVTETAGATAGYLEFTGQGLMTHERAQDRDERLMALLGSRMLEGQKKVAETAQALAIQHAAEGSVLANMATSMSRTITDALRWVYWWQSTEAMPEDVTREQVALDLNVDYETAKMTSDELNALVAAWQAGAISRESMHDLMRQGEVLADTRSNQEEAELIEADASHMPKAKDSQQAARPV